MSHTGGMELDRIVATAGDMISAMTPLGWAIAAGIALLFIVGIIKQLAKVAIVASLLFGVGIVLLNARMNDWQFIF